MDDRQRAEWMNALKEVERDENGIIILSPYGFKIEELNGKKYLMTRTKEEFEASAKKDGVNTSPGYCFGGGPTANCYPRNCPGGCVAIYQGPQAGYYCGCRD